MTYTRHLRGKGDNHRGAYVSMPVDDDMPALYDEEPMGEREPVNEDIQRTLIDEIRAEEAAIALASTTTLVPPQPPVLAAAKCKRDENAKLLIPPLPERNEKEAGGTDKPRGILFCATYDCSYTLANALGHLSKFYKFYPFTFTPDGMQLWATDSVRIMTVSLSVPRTAFLCYENLCPDKMIEITVSAQNMKQVAKGCCMRTSLSFIYDQYEKNNDEVLHLRRYPRTEADVNEAQEMRTSIAPSQIELEPLQPTDCYQYCIHMRPGRFVSNVRELSDGATVLALVPSQDVFEIASVSTEGTRVTTMPTNAVQMNPNNFDYKKIDETLNKHMCVIERVAGADERVTMKQLRGYKISAAYLRTAALVAGMPGCTRMKMWLGLIELKGVFTECPVRLQFIMRYGEPQAFTVDLWIAPRYNE